MGRIAVGADEQVTVPSGGFGFSTVKIDELGASEYTIATIVLDTSSSVYDFKDELTNCLKTILESCKKSPRADNLMLRLVFFDSVLNEIHGFRELETIDPNEYDNIVSPSGMTALYDAAYAGIEAVKVQGKNLSDNDFLANGIVFIITDGEENSSRMHRHAPDIKKLIGDAKKEEVLESLTTILVGVGNTQVRDYLDDFRNEAGIDQFVHIGDATASKLAKLAQFVSQSISSQSQALGSGGASTPVDPDAFGF